MVVDSAPADDSARFIAQENSAAYVVSPQPGASRARNLALLECNSEIVAFLDDDAVPLSGWLSEIIRPFSDPQIMIVTGYMAGLSAEAEAGWRKIGGTPGPRRAVHVDAADKDWLDTVIFCPFANGASMAVRRRSLELWGGFDPRLGPGSAIVRGEENYFLFQALQHGYKAAYVPTAIVQHPYPTTPMDLRNAYRRSVRVLGALIALIAAENPDYRVPLLRMMVGRLLRRGQHDEAGEPSRRPISKWHSALLAIRGMFDYFLLPLGADGGSPFRAAVPQQFATMTKL